MGKKRKNRDKVYISNSEHASKYFDTNSADVKFDQEQEKLKRKNRKK